jgi:peptidoglycan/xylan/chitin deacetylase (PgdA/CDA1 family)
MGWATPAILRRVAAEGYRPVLGTIYPADPHAPDADAIVEHVVARLAPGRILILHDGSSRGRPRDHTLQALPLILRQLEARGLRGVSVAALLETAVQGRPAAALAASAGRALDRGPRGARESRS